jgi:predicted GNAT family acetyltransferase/glutaredoxin
MLTLYQAEWCPYSSAVREVLTELGVDFVAKQVEPEPEQRERLRALAGTDGIPTLETEEGEIFRGTREIFRYLESLEPWEHAAAHRQRFLDHADARKSDGMAKIVARFRHDEPGPKVEAAPGEAVVVDVPEESRYELRLGDRRIGLAAYRLRDDNRIAFTHTEIDAECEGRGFGTRLVQGAVDDARARGLEIIPLCPFVAAYVKRHPEHAS